MFLINKSQQISLLSGSVMSDEAAAPEILINVKGGRFLGATRVFAYYTFRSE
jgi:hypothetical protein